MRVTTSLCAALVLLLGGCAASQVELKAPHPYGEDLARQSYSWHYLRFRWRWPEGRRPDWSRDALIADQVLSEVITRYRDKLPLWRFHRRAARTPAGHQFSFIFYAPDAVARAIASEAESHAMTRKLLAAGLLRQVELTRPEAAGVGATSDPRWPERLQAAWPMFIMGASQTWLALVESESRKRRSPVARDGDLEAQLEHYRSVSRDVNELWSEYAQHAFFHHLSGIFGYEPVRIRKDIHF